MIVYNNTIKVNNNILQAWNQWLVEEYIPEIMNTKLFEKYELYRLLEQEDVEGPTFVLQFFSHSINDYKTFLNKYATPLRKKEAEKWCQEFVAFRTILEAVQ